MRFFSDNAAACCPEVLAALADVNRLDTAYDGDALSKRLDCAFSDLFGREVRALWVATGPRPIRLRLPRSARRTAASSATGRPHPE
jgi:threonine aldolase